MTQKNRTIFSDMDDDEIIDFIRDHEDTVNHMYLDTRGNVTVGTGRMLPNKNSAKNIPFYLYENGKTDRYAAGFETGQAFDQVKKRKFGQNFTHDSFHPKYDPTLKKVFLHDEDAKILLKEDVIRSVDELRNKFDNFDAYPKSARKALVDMQFNLGDSKFQKMTYDPKTGEEKPGWPNLFDAVENKRWTDAATQSKRKGVGVRRNKDIEDLFMKSRHE